MLQCLFKDFVLSVEQIRAFVWASAASELNLESHS